MGHIEEFIAHYTREYDFYQRAASLVAGLLEADLRAAGIRGIVTSRAKATSRLEDKCKQRDREHAYTSVEGIYDDIVDLAGVRVALYFPAETAQVEAAIARLFEQVTAPKLFPAASRPRSGKRFSGYSAVHHRVQLREADMTEADRRYAAAKVEIQVASVLMHAWSEVEHDLVYKPLEGELSEDEYAILDQLNGLVRAGEIALERLQKAGELRVSVGGQRIANHYDLAVHLLGRAKEFPEQPERDLGLGRVDLLYKFLARLGIDTPNGLAPYLEGLHGNVEVRPFSEQVIDALLAQDSSRYDVYREVRAETLTATADRDWGAEQSYLEVGRFLTEWARLEALIRGIAVGKGRTRPTIPTAQELERLGLLDAGSRQDFDWLRRVRNDLVHGIEAPRPEELRNAADRIRHLTAQLDTRLNLKS